MIASEDVVRLATVQYPHSMAVHASGGKWKPYPYLKLIGRLIVDAVGSAQGHRILVNLPPRHGKSEFIARWVPLWFEEMFPTKRVVIGAHSDTLATSHGRFIRDTLEENPYFTTRLRQNSHAANRFDTEEGGGVICAGVGTGIMGFGGDLVIIDDPYPTWASAHSETYRKEVVHWFDQTIKSRCEPNATIVILHQRMHDEDLTATLMKNQPEEWKHVSLPAIADAGDPMGRKVGEPLCPSRYNVEALQRIQKTEIGGSFGWFAMYQQKPLKLASRRAYRMFAESHKDETVKYDPRLPLQISFDFNINPGMYCEIGQYDAERDQMTTVEEIYEPDLSIRELLQKLEPVLFLHPWKEIQIFGDASGSARNAETGKSNYDTILNKFKRLADEGRLKIRPRLNVPDSNGPVVDRLAVANDVLADVAGVHHYRVHPRCTRLIKDFSNVPLDKNGHPIKTDDELTHAGDAWTYRVLWLRPIGGPVKQTESEFVFAESTE